jgi:hypothetical protein
MVQKDTISPGQMMIPLSAGALAAVPRARATRVSYPWMGKTYTAWIGVASFFGWSVLTDYGVPGQECVVTSPHNREDCISALVPYMEEYGALALEWEQVSPVHDAWINWIRSSGGAHWAPLPAAERGAL